MSFKRRIQATQDSYFKPAIKTWKNIRSNFVLNILKDDSDADDVRFCLFAEILISDELFLEKFSS